MDKEILSKFDENGRRITSLVRGLNYNTDQEKATYLKNGFIQISEKDWNYYIGNFGKGKNKTGYVRDAKTGKPVDAPPYVPTKKEQAELLYGVCKADLKQIDAQLVNAVAIDDTELIADLKKERADRIKQYQDDLKKLEGGE